MQHHSVPLEPSLASSDDVGLAPPFMDSYRSAEVSVSDDYGEFLPGTILGGSYRLVRRLGRGGMGDIHLASHERMPGQFVVKVLSPDLVADEDAFVRFRQEAVAMASIRHPNVVQLVDFNFTPSGLPYLVMEYLPGKDLADILSSRPFLSAAQVSTIVRQVACALDAAHRRGIVHRDLKPENIMVVPCDGQGDLIKLIDFGISKARRFNHVTAGSMVIGTPEFMSPEQAEGRHEDVDSPSDQFALAVISYLLLTGRTPWGTAAPVEILHRVVNKGPMPVTRDETWRAVESVLFRGMSKSPAERYPSTLAFWRALDQAMVHDGLLPAATSFQAPLRPPVAEPSVRRESEHAIGGADAWNHSHEAPDGFDMNARPRGNAVSNVGNDDVGAELHDGGDELQGRPSSTIDDQDDLATSGTVDGTCDKTEEVTARVEASKRRRSRRGRHAAEAAVFLALACGTYVALLDVPAVRTRATDGWNIVRSLGVRAADKSVATGQRFLSRFSSSTSRKASIAEAAVP